MYSRMAIGRNDNYVQWTFTADIFCKMRKRENSTVGPGFMSWHGYWSFDCQVPTSVLLWETHAFCSRNMGVHVQCTCAKKVISSDFAKIMHNYVRKKKCSVVWPSVGMFGGVPQARMFWRFIITTWKKNVPLFRKKPNKYCLENQTKLTDLY